MRPCEDARLYKLPVRLIFTWGFMPKKMSLNLDAFIYNVGFKPDKQFKTQEEMISFLKENKFKVNEYEKNMPH